MDILSQQTWARKLLVSLPPPLPFHALLSMEASTFLGQERREEGIWECWCLWLVGSEGWELLFYNLRLGYMLKVRKVTFTKIMALFFLGVI